ncbi:hypothetical protein EXN66_Car021844 [Channa argus]|uniref:Uncharacterized protein n=1 Tax=Channa argus TaxID=215402 RepID=A0A6G1QU70_CHAAH|nr:hypothetical protein EXN66_Car021844 [Channa argus]
MEVSYSATISTSIPKHLQLEQFSERIARVTIFLAMTVHALFLFKSNPQVPNYNQYRGISACFKPQGTHYCSTKVMTVTNTDLNLQISPKNIKQCQ